MKLLMLGPFIAFIIMFLGVASAIYHTQPSSPYQSSPQSSPYQMAQPVSSPTPKQSGYPASSPFASQSPSYRGEQQPQLPQRQVTRQGPQIFNNNQGFWSNTFERQDFYFDNVNRPWCRQGRDFSSCGRTYPAFGYSYQQAWSGPGDRRFWR